MCSKVASAGPGAACGSPGQLIDASTGAHLWADRVDGSLEDVFDLQDEVATNVVGAIAPRVERAEIERVRRKPTESLDSYDYYLRGMASYHRPPFANRESTTEALRLFRRAIDLDPEFAAAYAMAAYCYVTRKGSGYRPASAPRAPKWQGWRARR